jgi:hypothetical protein
MDAERFDPLFRTLKASGAMRSASRRRSRRSNLASVGLAVCATAWWSGCGPATGGDAEFWAPAPRALGAGGSSNAAGGAFGSSGAAGGAGGSSGAAGGAGGSSDAAGSGSSQAASSTGAAPPPPADPTLSVGFTTVSYKGKYAPRNVGAVWVADGQDVFVKTLEVWAVKRIKYLEKWKGVSGGNGVDAITRATRSNHGSHALAWDMTDVGGNVVPDGVYRVYVEFTEQNGAGKWTFIEFVKGATPVESSPPDLPYFTEQHLTYTP